MVALVPQTIGRELTRKVNIWVERGRYVTKDEFEIASLFRDAEKLRKVDPYHGYIALAACWSLCANLEEMQRNFKKALPLGDKWYVYSQELIGLSNLGYTSEAREILLQLYTPERASNEVFTRLGYSLYAFDFLSDYFDKVKQMGLDLGNVDESIAKRANSLLLSTNTDPRVITQITDVAGEVLREHRLMCSGKIDDIDVADDPDDDKCIYIILRVNTSHEEAASLYDEFVRRLVEKFDHLPSSVHVQFRSGL